VSEYPAFTDTERTRSSSSTSVVLQSPFANPILLVDPQVDLFRGLQRQLTRVTASSPIWPSSWRPRGHV
jgi:hypothetical protein